jgi:hypothetical protein
MMLSGRCCSMTKPLNGLRLAVSCVTLSVVLSACGSTVAMSTRSPAGDGLAPGQSQSLSQGSDAPGTGSGQEVAGSTSSSGGLTPAGGAGGTAGATLRPGDSSAGVGPGALTPGPAPQGPLKFGLLDVSSPAAAVGAIGVQAQTSVNEQDLAHAYIRYFNAHGGIAGRKLEPVEYTQNPSSPNYQSDMQAACAKFTQDNKLTVVIRAQLGGLTPENYESCLTKARVTSLEMSYAVGDNTMLARHPQLYDVSAPSVDRRERAVLTGLAGTGYLTTKNTVGVLVEDCPEDQRAYQNTVVPLARSLGLHLTTRTVGCLTGDGDLGAFSAQVQSAVLPFRSAGVDRVTFVSGWEPLMLLFFETNAANQSWKPFYALSSNAVIGSTVGEYSAEQQSRMRGIGWAPSTDTGSPMTNAATKKCDAMARSEGVSPQTQGDVALVRLVCEVFLVFKAAVEAAGGRDDSASLAMGLASATRSYVSATVLGGKLRLGDGHQDGATQAAEFGFVSSCTCFRYVGRPRPLV